MVDSVDLVNDVDDGNGVNTDVAGIMMCYAR